MSARNGTTFVRANGSAGPVHQFQVVVKGEGNTLVITCCALEGEQGGPLLPAVLVFAFCQSIITIKIGAPDAAGNAAVIRRDFGGNLVFSGLWHGFPWSAWFDRESVAVTK